MTPIDTTIIVAIITSLGGFAVGLANTFGSKNQKVIDLISTRLAEAETRLDHLEGELSKERERRLSLSVYSSLLRNWCRNAYVTLIRHDPEYPKPPAWIEISASSDHKMEEEIQ